MRKAKMAESVVRLGIAAILLVNQKTRCAGSSPALGTIFLTLDPE
jgi:hypothetical protein